jgi:hypothetical protein
MSSSTGLHASASGTSTPFRAFCGFGVRDVHSLGVLLCLCMWAHASPHLLSYAAACRRHRSCSTPGSSKAAARPRAESPHLSTKWSVKCAAQKKVVVWGGAPAGSRAIGIHRNTLLAAQLVRSYCGSLLCAGSGRKTSGIGGKRVSAARGYQGQSCPPCI